MKAIEPHMFDVLVPVQIIGTQRSGSNLLRLMLNQIQEVNAPHPPHILHTFIPLMEHYGDLSEDEQFRQLVRDVCTFVELNAVPWKDARLDPELIMESCRERTLMEVYRRIYEVNTLQRDKKVWVNKSMQNVYFIDLFERHGFKPLIIHLVRDGRDVSLSFKRTIVGEKHVYHLARQWREDQEISGHYVNKYGPGKALQVRYEDLLNDPTGQMQRICHFLKVPFTEKVFQYYTSDESLLAAQSGEMWVNLVKPIIRDNYNKYRQGLEAWEIELFEKVASSYLDRYGYPLEFDFNGRDFSFTESTLKEYDRLNEQMKQEVLHQASSQELERRARQQEHIRSIRERMKIL